MNPNPNEILLHKCAESEVYLKKDFKLKSGEIIEVILKHRIPKSYRIPEIEKMISLSRLKKESNNLIKAEKLGLPVPHIYKTEKTTKKIFLEYFKNYQTVKNYISKETNEENKNKNLLIIFKELGKIIAKLHNNNIIHGDLTSSNMMINNKNDLKLIDFGLSSISNNIEEKAVDLYVFEKSLLCEKDSNGILKEILKAFYIGYEDKSKNWDKLWERLEKVKLRGRKKLAFG